MCDHDPVFTIAALVRRWIFWCCAATALASSGCGGSALKQITSGKTGCPRSEVEISNYDDGTSVGERLIVPAWVIAAKDKGVRSWAAQCGTKLYYCSGVIRDGGQLQAYQVSCSERGPGRSQELRSNRPRRAFPDSAGGFAFGQTPADAKDTCEGAGRHWSMTNANEATCSGTPAGPSSMAEARLTFSDNALRGVILGFVTDEDPSKWVSQFHDLEAPFKGKYGLPQKTQTEKPPECEGQLVSCLNVGRAFRMSTWNLGSSSIIVRLGRTEDSDSMPLLFVEYHAPSAKAPDQAK